MTYRNLLGRVRLRVVPQFFLLAVCCLAGLLLEGSHGDPGTGFAGVSLKVLDQAAPAGGTIQFTVSLTEPKPIVTGRAAAATSPALLGAVQGVALYGGAPDVAGAAVVTGNALTVRSTAPSGVFGTDPTVPLLVVTIAVRPDAPLGASSSLVLDPASSLWTDPSGQPYPQQVKSGTFVVQGSLSISDVNPGSGLLPAGSTVVVTGIGFQPQTKVEVDGVGTRSTFISPTEIDVVLATQAEMYGRRVTATNPDSFRSRYYAYQRAPWLGQSARPLLAATEPLFARETLSGARFADAAPAGRFLGLALQNPNADPADVSIELRSTDDSVIASTAFTLPSQNRISLELSEYLTGVVPPAGSSLVVHSSLPTRVLGLIGDESAGSVEPVKPSPFP
jgi:IPT/TIG domain